MLGSGAIIVVDDSNTVVDVALKVAQFYRHESCGKCSPCREGTTWTVKMIERMRSGEATPMDLDIMASVQTNIIGNCLCVLGDAMAMPIGSMIEKFRPEFEAYIEERRRELDLATDEFARAAAPGPAGSPLVPRPELQEITFSIDGREVQAPANMMLVDAAKRGDIEIPVFCYEPKLGQPVGACRMCLVEVEGIPKLQTACSTPVKDGMVVHTQTERVREAQAAVVEFLLVNHPLDCPVCDKGGECPLQDISFGWGGGRSRFIEPKRHFQKPLELSPLVAIDRERCILCYRCVRFSQEVSEDYQLILQERGADTYVATFDGHPYVAPFSGNIVELCPVGALTSKPYRFRARPWDIENSGVGVHAVPVAVQRDLHRPRRARPARARPRPRGRRRRLAVRQGPLRLPGRPRRGARHAPDGARRRRAAAGVVGPRAARGRRARSGARRAASAPSPAGQTTNEEGFLLQRADARGARVAARRLLAARLARARRPRRAGEPAPPGDGQRPRVRAHRPRARLRADRRRADPRPAHPQGRAAAADEARGRDVAAERARPQRGRARTASPPAAAPTFAARCARARAAATRRRRCATSRGALRAAGKEIVIVVGERSAPAALELAEALGLADVARRGHPRDPVGHERPRAARGRLRARLRARLRRGARRAARRRRSPRRSPAAT